MISTSTNSPPNLDSDDMRLVITKHDYRLAAFLVTVLISSAAPLRAQDSKTTFETIELDPITISGDWLGEATETNVKDYPGARSVLSEKELHTSGNRTLEDALRQVPSVRIEDEAGTGVLPNIGIRGLNPLRSERVMVLQDGIPLSLAPYTGTGLSLFPTTLETIERVDVVRGGGAVHYGPNNVSGVINLISRPIPREFSGAVKQKLSVDEATGNLLSNTYGRVGGFITPNFGLQAQLNAITGKGGRDHSDTDVLNFILDGEWYLSNRDSLKGRLQYYDVKADLPGALSPAQYVADRTQSRRPHDGFDAKTMRGSLVYNREIGNNAEFNWTNFINVSERSFQFGQPFDPSVTDTTVSSSPRDFFVAGSEARYTYRFDTGPTSHKLIFGGRYVRENVDFVVDSLDLATGTTSRARDWRFETDAVAAYVSDTMTLMDGNLEITPGLRYEFVDTTFRNNADNSQSSNDTGEFLPGLAVGYQTTDSVFLFANANRSLRVPQVAQVTRSAPVENELAWNYELGMRYALDADFSVTATAFRIDFSDQIEFDRPSLTFQNLGKTRHEGLELEARWTPAAIPELELRGNYTFVDTKQRAGANVGNQVPFASRHQLNLAVDYTLDRWALGLNGSYRSSAFSDAANTRMETADGAAGKLPSAWVWNMQMSKDLDIPGRDIRLTGAVHNIFNEDYYVRGVDVSPIGRVAEPGRSFSLALEAKF